MRPTPRHGPVPLERLLDEEAFDGTALSRVLAAARAPARPDELAGLESARLAFRQQVATPRHRVASSRGRAPASTGARTLAGRLLAAKAVAAVSGATLIGGVAYAASSGVLTNAPSLHPSAGSSAGHLAPRPVASGGYPYGPIGTVSSRAASPASTPAAQPHPHPRRHTPTSVHPSHPPTHSVHPHPTGPPSTPRASRSSAPPTHGHKPPHKPHPTPSAAAHPPRSGRPS